MYRIWVVDAEEAFRIQIRRMATDLDAGAIQLKETEKASEACVWTHRALPDLLITDVAQAGVCTLLDLVRLSGTGEPMILIASHSTDVCHMRYAIRVRALDYLTKPVRLEELIAILRGQIETHRRTEENCMPFPWDDQSDPDIVQTVQRAIEMSGNHMFTVLELAEYTHITPNYLSYLFKKRMGISLNAFQRQVKMSQARQLLLENPRTKISAIASMLGYSDEKYFSRVFSRYHHVTPSTFRTENAADARAESIYL